MPQLAVVVVVEQMDALFLQGFARLVQTFGQFVHRGFIAVIKPVHPGDDHILCAEALGFLGHCVGIPLQRAKVGVQADHLKACLLHQLVPVQVAALAHRHTGIPAALVSSFTTKPMGWIINPHSSMPSYPAAFMAARVSLACCSLLSTVPSINCCTALMGMAYPSSLKILPGVMPFSLKLSTQT